jgi:hypothetical protein
VAVPSGLAAAACVVLIAGAAGVFLLDFVGDWVLYGLILICPLLHFLLMKGHSH